ncbi:response regulator [Alicyclobacillus fastidiosus]|uniref:Response regulator n=1 Tax=Alicyclobacillus fastidiosus TaxID=392011 RepID=A0ABV5AKU3_9BACL|nr:response regulator [Alicyclobacillus fastidiosus]WEH10261.1 response regulator [Alicyclobacillus fastidiosus]
MTDNLHAPARVALIEDDEQLASTLARQLSRYEFEPVLVDCHGDIVEAVNALSPHVILLDINLPKYDGFYWCRRIRENSFAPIIFVSARNAGMDQVFALENGGDDYVALSGSRMRTLDTGTSAPGTFDISGFRGCNSEGEYTHGGSGQVESVLHLPESTIERAGVSDRTHRCTHGTCVLDDDFCGDVHCADAPARLRQHHLF